LSGSRWRARVEAARADAMPSSGWSRPIAVRVKKYTARLA
jgi:hypothetical protein